VNEAEAIPEPEAPAAIASAELEAPAPARAPTTTRRILITGSPKAGKTNFSELLGRELGCAPRHTDETMALFPDLPPSERWSAQSLEVANWFDAPGPWIVEGVVIPRALRKWLKAHPAPEKPCDAVLFLERPAQELSKGQETMRKGIATVWGEIRAELEARGVVIEAR
jgi:hypothetical protein